MVIRKPWMENLSKLHCSPLKSQIQLPNFKPLAAMVMKAAVSLIFLQ